MGSYLIRATPIQADGGALHQLDGGLASEMGPGVAYAADGGLECKLNSVVGNLDGNDLRLLQFTFEAILSMDDAGQAYLTLAKGYSRDANYDGQFVRSPWRERSYFSECSECWTQVHEDINFALLSDSQAEALGDSCPSNPLTGGVPTPDDAGLFPPGPRGTGFDALLVCGEIRTQVLVDAGPPDGGLCPEECGACRTFYRLTGERR